MPRKSKSALAATPPAAELFVKISATGAELPLTAKNWEAVKHLPTGLIYSAELQGTEQPWKQAIAQPPKLKLAGRSDWRAASRVEALHIVDDTTFGPAVDTRFFRYPKYGWAWTSTKDVEYPESGAWALGLYYGDASRGYQSNQGFAIAVCGPVPSAGQ